MANQAQSLLKSRREDTSDAITTVPSLGLQHVWFKIAGAKTGQSLALVPVEPEVSTLAAARSMALVAAQQPHSRVLVVNASLAGCQAALSQESAVIVRPDFNVAFGEGLAANCDYVDFAQLCFDEGERALTFAPRLLDDLATEGKRYNVAIFAVDSPLVQTRAIPLVRSLDAVAICVALGRTTFAAARELVDIVGRERVIGAVTLES